MFEPINDRVARSRAWRTASALVIALTLCAVGVPAVAAADPTAAPTAQQGPRGQAGVPLAAAFLRGVVRADFTVVKRDGTSLVIHYERGEITALSDTSITITGRDGRSAAFALSDRTRVRAKGRPAKISDLEVGDRAMVFGESNGGSYKALLIRCIVSPSERR